MITRKGVAFILVLVAALSLTIVATGSGAPAPLLIAVEGPQSGAQASNGVDQLRGVRLAVVRDGAGRAGGRGRRRGRR